MLEVIGLSCLRNECNLFAEVSFVLQAGQCLQIHGANGVGKSTLLRTLVGLYSDYVGNFTRKVTSIYIGHQHALHPDLTVKQNLDFFNVQCTDYNYFAIGKYQDILCKELSAGLLQRVSLTRLVASAHKLWVIDEPFVNLDAAAKAQFNVLAQEHLVKGGSMLIVTHEHLDYGVSICLQN